MKRILPLLLLLGATHSHASDWRDQLRQVALVDFLQTEQTIKRRNGWHERNPEFKSTTSLESLVLMGIYTEVEIGLIRLAPRKAQPVLGTMVVLLRSIPVLENARRGCPQKFALSLVNIRFRS